MFKITGNPQNPQDMVPGLDRSDKPGISLQEALLNHGQFILNLEAMIQAASQNSEFTSQLYQKMRQGTSKKLKDPESPQRGENEDEDDSGESTTPEDHPGPAMLVCKLAKSKRGSSNR
jgi:hypothetical protein